MARKLVLCSDGTGNSGGKARGTNVWRFYQALIKHPERQIAFYQDGVGTQSFKFFKVLGGAFGLGLNANLREMYAFLVHNFKIGDEIYLLGFSRGAFTVRALAYLLAHDGIVKPDDDDPKNTERRIEAVLSSYHRSRAEIRKFGKEADLGLDTKAETSLPLETFLQSYQYLGKLSLKQAVQEVQKKAKPPPLPLPEKVYESLPPQGVKFIGVWDTVDAVGLPIDELTEALDWLFKFRFYSYDRYPIAEHNYHALSLDDERHTFHPVMWEEWRDERGKDRVTDRHVDQVWFPGVHSNVGGGYPKDEMAHVPLYWMMQKAEAVDGGNGLLFLPELRAEAAGQGNPAGKIYDSRAGLAAYYRYKPRNLPEICKQAHAPVKLHPSIFQRVERFAEGYAPVIVPAEYEIEPGGGHHANDQHRDLRLAAQEVADQVIWWRRGLYFLLLATTGGLLLAVHRFAAMPLPQSEGWAGLIERIPAYFSEFLPGFLEKLLAAFNGRAGALISFILGFSTLFLLRGYLKARTGYLGKLGWNLAAGNTNHLPEKTLLEALAVAIKHCYASQRIRDFVRQRLFPMAVFSSAAMLLVLWMFNALALPPNMPVCGSQQVEAKRLDGIGDKRVLSDFHTCNPWYATGIALVKGETYLVRVRETSDWMDGQIPASPDGLRANPGFMQKLMAFARRDWQQGGGTKEGWFQLVAAVGGRQQIAVGSGKKFTADHSGPLYFYVNDAQCDLCLQGQFDYYRNNRGTAEITVSRIAR
ncbi:MAG: DUF2235 domain-containing protein [Gammaproteobacteria bacterium]|nr:DUF2235 domain-containing protein [Gammaproteobacteria bacterium]MBU1653848.1 DUF2235 domain-containing protein [Gammaproteobacteria bacterium]MBU1961035.1 DUF2235 domain-containing protein [Gammaproteobacteria bacterium]